MTANSLQGSKMQMTVDISHKELGGIIPGLELA